MIISVNWLKKYTDIDMPIDELTALIGERLVEIEEVIPLGEKYQDVLVVKVVECRPIEDSDHLNLTKIDDGGVTQDIERDENGLIQVVCGAPNVYAGMLAAWLPPRSTVPETFGSNEPFVLGSRALRGYMSNGMLASAKELDLYEDHTGIIEVDKAVAAGARFADVYELDDYLLDIENKSLTHRPDAFGVIGFAREVAGIQGHQFHTPDWLWALESSHDSTGEVDAPRVIIEEDGLSDRLSVVVLGGVNSQAVSPVEMQTYLARSGMRPVSAIVDIANYLMLLTGQPLHTYDYDKFLKVSGGVNEIRVRSARQGETLSLIDGRTITLTGDDMVIAAGDTPVGLAGAIGGAATEIDAQTTRVLIECATFDLYKLRALQMRHGIFTEAITRLTKGVPAPLGIPVLDQAMKLLAEHTGAIQLSQVGEDYPGRAAGHRLSLAIDSVNRTLGTVYSDQEIEETLNAVELSSSVVDGVVSTEVPYWRHDLVISEDIIEEVGRLRGFDSIPAVLPARSFRAVRPTDFDRLRSVARRALVRAGANEVLTYSFVHGDVMRKSLQDPDDAYRIVNSISPDLQYYRQSLIPSLLTMIHPNGKAGYGHFALFECNKTHTKRAGLTDEAVPYEKQSLALVIAATKRQEGAAFYEAKQYLEYLAGSLGVTLVYDELLGDDSQPETKPFEPKRSAIVWNSDKTVRIGVIGEFRRSVARDFKLPESTAGFELDAALLLSLERPAETAYRPLSRFPAIERDVSFQVPLQLSYGALYQVVTRSLEDAPFEASVAPLDLYRPDDEVKNITMRFVFTAHDRTLTGQEVGAYMEAVINSVTSVTNGKVI